MADRRERRRGAPTRTLIVPLLMLAGGVLTSAMVWRLLMLDPGPHDRPVVAEHARAAAPRR